MSELVRENSVHVDVLCLYNETEKEYGAVAISMDIWGYGNTPDDAIKECMDNVVAQVSFAVQSDDMTLLDFPADEEYQKLFRDSQMQQIKDRFTKGAQSRLDEVLSRAYEAQLPESLPQYSFA